MGRGQGSKWGKTESFILVRRLFLAPFCTCSTWNISRYGCQFPNCSTWNIAAAHLLLREFAALQIGGAHHFNAIQDRPRIPPLCRLSAWHSKKKGSNRGILERFHRPTGRPYRRRTGPRYAEGTGVRILIKYLKGIPGIKKLALIKLAN